MARSETGSARMSGAALSGCASSSANDAVSLSIGNVMLYIGAVASAGETLATDDLHESKAIHRCACPLVGG